MFRLINKYKTGAITLEKLNKRLTSYFGWLKYCDSKKLLQKIERETGIHYSNWSGAEDKISNFYGKSIHIVEVVQYKKYFKIHFVYKGKSYSVRSRSKYLLQAFKSCKFSINFKLN